MGNPDSSAWSLRVNRSPNATEFTPGVMETLITMAGIPEAYYFAPDSSHLKRIYEEVARDIDCPPESFWGRR